MAVEMGGIDAAVWRDPAHTEDMLRRRGRGEQEIVDIMGLLQIIVSFYKTNGLELDQVTYMNYVNLFDLLR